MAPPILLRVISDERAARNQDVAVDDDTPQSGVASDADAGHQNRLLDLAEAVHADVRAEDAAHDAAAGDDAAARDDRVERLPAAAPLGGKDELRRRRLRLRGAQRPFGVVEVELRVDLAQVHAGLEVRIQRSDVAPVLRGLFILVVEPVRVDRRGLNERRDDVLAEVVLAVLPRRIFLERAFQHVGAEDVNAHRRERRVGRARRGRRPLRLLLEADHPIGFVDADDAEARRIRDRHLDGGNRRLGALLLMEPQHLRVVHLVDVVAGQDDDVARRFTGDRIEVLVDRIRRAEIPVLVDTLLRRQDFDEFAELFGDDAPSHSDMPVERRRLVLRGDVDVPQA